MVGLTVAFSICMLAVTGTLTYRLIDGIKTNSIETAIQPIINAQKPSEIHTPLPKPSSTTSSEQTNAGIRQSDTTATSNNSGDPVANAISAISAVVAVVTLILTLGTTWFSDQLQKFDKLKKELETEIHNVKNELMYIELEREVSEALRRAKADLLSYMINKKLVRNPAQEHIDWTNQLERLLSNDIAIRQEGFERLQVYAPTGMNDPIDTELQSIVYYTEICHKLALKRLHMSIGHNPKEMADAISNGLWCLVFNEKERLRHKLQINCQHKISS